MNESTSETIDDGGSAFPAMLPGGNYCTTGMSLRDWFAGQALAGLLADSNILGTDKWFAEAVYRYADAMLNAREKTYNDD